MRIGLFGGTFDPPHLGHLIVARDALESLDLDQVRFMPAHVSPFKRDTQVSSAEDRWQLVQAAIAGEERFEASRDEIDRDPPSYTVDTLRDLVAAQPDAEWTLLVGADQWASFSSWRDPAAIGALARIAVLTRDGQRPEQGPTGLDVEWTRVDVTRIDISSSRIRARRRAGRSIRYLVPEAVRTLIESKGLYATC